MLKDLQNGKVIREEESTDPTLYRPVIDSKFLHKVYLRSTLDFYMHRMHFYFSLFFLGMYSSGLIGGMLFIASLEKEHLDKMFQVSLVIAFVVVIGGMIVTARIAKRKTVLYREYYDKFSAENQEALTRWLLTHHGIEVPEELNEIDAPYFADVANALEVNHSPLGNPFTFNDSFIFIYTVEGIRFVPCVKTGTSAPKTQQQPAGVEPLPYKDELAKEYKKFNKKLTLAQSFQLNAEEQHVISRVENDLNTLIGTLDELEKINRPVPEQAPVIITALIAELQTIVQNKEARLLKDLEHQASWVVSR